jgi:hypothetical protein
MGGTAINILQKENFMLLFLVGMITGTLVGIMIIALFVGAK